MSNIILRRVPAALCESEVLPLDTHPVSRPMAVLASRVEPVEAASLIRFLANTHEAVESRREETLRQLARQQMQQVRVQAYSALATVALSRMDLAACRRVKIRESAGGWFSNCNFQLEVECD